MHPWPCPDALWKSPCLFFPDILGTSFLGSGRCSFKMDTSCANELTLDINNYDNLTPFTFIGNAGIPQWRGLFDFWIWSLYDKQWHPSSNDDTNQADTYGLGERATTVKCFRRLPYEERRRSRSLHRRRLRGDLISVYKIFPGGLDLESSAVFIPPVRPGLRGHPFKVL